MCKYINIQIPSILNEAEVLMHQGATEWISELMNTTPQWKIIRLIKRKTEV
jgi:hypothetical protein